MKIQLVTALFFVVHVNVGSLNCMGLPPRQCFNDDKIEVSVRRIQHRLTYALDVVNDSIDNLLRANSAERTFLLLKPFLILYSHYYGIAPLEGIMNKIYKKAGKQEANIELQKQLGKASAYWDLVANDPLGLAEMYLAKLFDDIFKCECNCCCKCLPCF